jgi:hypothetical protein
VSKIVERKASMSGALGNYVLVGSNGDEAQVLRFTSGDAIGSMVKFFKNVS